MPTNRLGMVLKAAGYQSIRKKINGVKLLGWAVYQRNSNEINAIKNVEH